MLRLQRGDLLHLDARPELDLVAGDGGPAGAAGDGGVDLELVQHLADGVGHLAVGRAALLGRVTGDQQAQRRQRVGTLDDPVQLLGVPFSGPAAAPDGGFRDGRDVVLEGGRRGTGRRPGLRVVVGVESRVVVIAVGEIFARGGTRVVGKLIVVVVGVVGVIALVKPGAEHGTHRIGHLADRGPGQQQQPEQRADEQQRRGDPGRQPVRQRPPDRKSDESTRAAAQFRVFRRTGPQMAQAEIGQGDQAPAEDQPGPRLGVGLCAHQQHRQRRGDDREHQDGRADKRAKRGVDPRTDRPGGVEP